MARLPAVAGDTRKEETHTKVTKVGGGREGFSGFKKLAWNWKSVGLNFRVSLVTSSNLCELCVSQDLCSMQARMYLKTRCIS
jgi:hypothetical protein